MIYFLRLLWLILRNKSICDEVRRIMLVGMGLWPNIRPNKKALAAMLMPRQ
jgi:hypothetical protein